MELIGAIIAGAFIGIIIGVLAKGVAPSTRNNLPLWLTIICGISAAIIGWLIYTTFITDTPGIDRIRWLITVVVAAILVVIANAIMARSRPKRSENEAKPSRAEEVGKVLSQPQTDTVRKWLVALAAVVSALAAVLALLLR